LFDKERETGFPPEHSEGTAFSLVPTHRDSTILSSEALAKED
jgi:hypothetical protein